MSTVLTDDDFLFKQVRWGTDQWEVYLHDESGPPVARVTERIIATPSYAISIGEQEYYADDRDGVMTILRREARP